MNFESLKTGFMSYLDAKLRERGESLDSSQDASYNILKYNNEFKEYLKQELGNKASVFRQNISDMQSLGFSNGQFSYDTDSPNLLADIINDALKQETVQKALDADESGDISQEEINSFLQSVSKNGKISFDGITNAANDILNNYNTDYSREVNNLLNDTYINSVYKILTESKNFNLVSTNPVAYINSASIMPWIGNTYYYSKAFAAPTNDAYKGTAIGNAIYTTAKNGWASWCKKANVTD